MQRTSGYRVPLLLGAILAIFVSTIAAPTLAAPNFGKFSIPRLVQRVAPAFSRAERQGERSFSSTASIRASFGHAARDLGLDHIAEGHPERFMGRQRAMFTSPLDEVMQAALRVPGSSLEKGVRILRGVQFGEGGITTPVVDASRYVNLLRSRLLGSGAVDALSEGLAAAGQDYQGAERQALYTAMHAEVFRSYRRLIQHKEVMTLTSHGEAETFHVYASAAAEPSARFTLARSPLVIPADKKIDLAVLQREGDMALVLHKEDNIMAAFTGWIQADRYSQNRPSRSRLFRAEVRGRSKTRAS